MLSPIARCCLLLLVDFLCGLLVFAVGVGCLWFAVVGVVCGALLSAGSLLFVKVCGVSYVIVGCLAFVCCCCVLRVLTVVDMYCSLLVVVG